MTRWIVLLLALLPSAGTGAIAIATTCRLHRLGCARAGRAACGQPVYERSFGDADRALGVHNTPQTRGRTPRTPASTWRNGPAGHGRAGPAVPAARDEGVTIVILSNVGNMDLDEFVAKIGKVAVPPGSARRTGSTIDAGTAEASPR